MTGSWFLDHLWLVPLLPFLGSLLVALVLRPLTSPRVCSAAAIAAVAGSAIVGWGAAFAYFTRHAGETLVPWQTLWLAFTPTFAGNVGVIADDLSMLLVMVVTGVSLLVHIYSTGYLHGEGGYSALLRRASTSSPARCSGWSSRSRSSRSTSSGNSSASRLSC